MRRLSSLSVSIVIIATFYLVAILAGFVAPYGFANEDREHTNCPPMRLHIIDSDGRWNWRPFVYEYEEIPGDLERYQEDRSRKYSIQFLTPGSKYKFVGVIPTQTHLFGVQTPGRLYLFGTDEYGRDQFSRFVYGGQVSLLVGTLATAISLTIGLAVGSLCGVFGGWIDVVTMRFTELFMVLPWLYLLLAVRAILPLRTSGSATLIILMSVLALVGWAKPARLFRGVILSAQELDFVIAASAMGGSRWYVMRRHVLPQTRTILLIQAALLIPQFIAAEVTLSFLGLGVSEPNASWGAVISPLARYESIATHWWLVLPVCAVVPLFFSYHEVTSSLQTSDQTTMM
jgi:peptide/nickel transport system permease protein